MKWKLIEINGMKMFDGTNSIMVRFKHKEKDQFKSMLYFLIRNNKFHIIPEYDFEVLGVQMGEEEYIMYQTSINFLLWSAKVRVLYN